jgi:hypothetical protein
MVNENAKRCLCNQDLLVVLTTAPTGLGHVRVMQALRQGLPDGTQVEETGIRDREMQILHRASSINPQLRALMEFVQTNPVAEGGFTRWYRAVLRRRPEAALHQLTDLVERHRPRPKTVVVLCTHFGLAHQIAVIKEEWARLMDIKVILAVVVTDDSPQLVWAVPGADIEFVPSASTRTILWGYLEKVATKVPELVVVPYPVSPKLGEPLVETAYRERTDQLKPKSTRPLQVMVPVSGAAVQLDYLKEMMAVIIQNGEMAVSVVSRESSYTHAFLDWCQEEPGIRVYAHWLDKEVVNLYERVYEEKVIGVEVTKPSEQTFKALLTPKMRGGVILLFAEPVGRQEDDNLMFLRRHNLLPALDEQREIDKWAVSSEQLSARIISQSKHWRGLMLPLDGRQAGEAIKKYRESGLLKAMSEFSGFMPGHEELNADGVEKIWEKLGEKI